MRASGGITVVPQKAGAAALRTADMIVVPGWRNVQEARSRSCCVRSAEL